ncbi:MAG: cysteine-rich CWC family protein [Rhizobacter sp.]|nr:cysteine-rich CWC family protein [Rhizobacter sp.]
MSDAACPRCGGAFHCGANDTAPCPCGNFTLSASTTQRLREQYGSCLCMACLAQLQDPPAPETSKPAQP